MATPTNQELLDACLEAIRKVLAGGQSAQWDGHQVTMSDLPKLEAARDRLERRIRLESSTSSPAARYQQASFR